MVLLAFLIFHGVINQYNIPINSKLDMEQFFWEFSNRINRDGCSLNHLFVLL